MPLSGTTLAWHTQGFKFKAQHHKEERVTCYSHHTSSCRLKTNNCRLCRNYLYACVYTAASFVMSEGRSSHVHGQMNKWNVAHTYDRVYPTLTRNGGRSRAQGDQEPLRWLGQQRHHRFRCCTEDFLLFNNYNLMSLILRGNWVYSVFSWNYSGGICVPTGYNQSPT